MEGVDELGFEGWDNGQEGEGAVLQGVYIPRVFYKLCVSVKKEKRGKEEKLTS